MRLIAAAALCALFLFGCTEQTSESGAEATGTSCEGHPDVASCLDDERCGWRTDKGACAVKPKSDEAK